MESSSLLERVQMELEGLAAIYDGEGVIEEEA